MTNEPNPALPTVEPTPEPTPPTADEYRTAARVAEYEGNTHQAWTWQATAKRLKRAESDHTRNEKLAQTMLGLDGTEWDALPRSERQDHLNAVQRIVDDMKADGWDRREGGGGNGPLGR